MDNRPLCESAGALFIRPFRFPTFAPFMSDQKPTKRAKKRLGSYPSVSVVFSIALALFVLGLFGVLLIHTNRLSELIQENLEIQVYLNKEVNEAQRTKVLKALSTNPYVLQKDGEAQISYVSREEAAVEFIESTGEDFSDFLGDNPLRDLYRVRISPTYQHPDSLKEITTSIASMGGVFEVEYVENLVASINQNLTKIGLVLVGFAAILIVIVIILINNTIKLALFSQRFLIRSMQLVGATGRFIRRPFLLRAAFYGFVAGLLSVAGLTVLTSQAYGRVQDLSQLTDPQKTYILYGGVLLLGIFIAVISTYRAISKYLAMSLDDLY